jgi:hypothetical protein
MFDQVASAQRLADSILQCEIVLAIVTAIVLAGRLFVQTTRKARFGADDYMVIVAHIFRYATAGLAIATALIAKDAHAMFDPGMVWLLRVCTYRERSCYTI